MAKAIYNVNSINIDDLNSSSATMKYPIGATVCIKDEDKAQPDEYIYVKAHAAFATAGTPFAIECGSGGSAEVVTAAPTAQASGVKLGFNTSAITSGEYFWAQIGGELTAAASAGIAAGDHVEVIAAGTTVIVDGTTGSTVHSTKSIGIAKTAVSGGEITLVIAPGRTVEIAAA